MGACWWIHEHVDSSLHAKQLLFRILTITFLIIFNAVIIGPIMIIFFIVVVVIVVVVVVVVV